ncbi:amidase [Amycolatopsis sp. lyj-112]|uniref:allophanate hydrolase-related protein n=1 Tax=Amycolatopsis sp. lyj-112 TaxID=2789288 RepID=UPI00397991E4
MPELFCSGDAMRGGRLHHTVSSHPFLGEVRTAPHYRMYSVRDEFPALEEDPSGGVPLAGEIYDVPLTAIRTDFLASEPPELELTVIELDDGRDALAVGLRPGVPARQLTDITEHGGWRAYRALTHVEEVK